MKFVYPEFLFALFTLAIPIIIHLFNFRKFKKVYFSNVRFLKEVKQETRSRSRIKHWLVLTSRLLALTFLVLAFAQPYQPADENDQTTGKQAISVFLDNSFSMNAENSDGMRLFEVARQYGFEIGNGYSATDNFQLLTQDFEGRHQRLVTQEEFSTLVEEVEISPSVRKLSEVITRQRDALKNQNEEQKNLFIVSDFQKSITDFEAWEIDSNLRVRLIPLPARQTGNLYIDSVWFDDPIRQVNKPDQLWVRIRNNSDQTFEDVSLQMKINGQNKALASVNIDAGSYTDTVLAFTASQTGIQNAEVSISENLVDFDNHFFLNYSIAENISVLSIQADTNEKSIRSVFRLNDYFLLEEAGVNQLDYSNLPEKDLIVLSGLNDLSSGLIDELRKFTENGGSLMIFPGNESELISYQALLGQMGTNVYQALDTGKTEVTRINTDHPVYRDVLETQPEGRLDLPTVSKHFPLSRNIQTNEEVLLELRDGSPFLAQYRFGQGKIYLCTSPLDANYSSFTQHAFFLPTLFEVAFLSQSSAPLYYTLGKEESLKLNNIRMTTENVFHLVSPEAEFDIIPRHRVVNNQVEVLLENTVEQAGNYRVDLEGRPVAGVAFNFERTESDLSTYSLEELQEGLKANGLDQVKVLDTDYSRISKTINEISQGLSYWFECIILVLVFLLIEVLLLKFWK